MSRTLTFDVWVVDEESVFLSESEANVAAEFRKRHERRDVPLETGEAVVILPQTSETRAPVPKQRVR